jgi:hypothetical protein
MRRFHWMMMGLVACLCLGTAAPAGEIKLKDGTIYQGDISTMNSQGIIVKKDNSPDGESPFTKRIPWKDLTQDTLKQFVNHPQARRYVELLIELPPEQIQQQLMVAIPEIQRPEIQIAVEPSPGRPHAGASLMGAMFSGGGLLLLLILYGANLYASFEIAHFRNYPWIMVAGIAAAAPLITPIIFLCLPFRRETVVEEETVEEEEESGEEEAVVVEVAPVEVAPAAPPVPPTKYFKRGEFNINRRFIETKFAGFFRAIPSDEDRDLNLVIKSARGEFTGRRVLKITNTELTFQVPKGEGATVDEVIPLNDILEIQIRHKDATD